MLVYAAVYCNFMLFAASYVKLTDKNDTEVIAETIREHITLDYKLHSRLTLAFKNSKILLN